jgi:hypothetical protein
MARAVDSVITFSHIKTTMINGGKPPRTLSCRATRTSVDRVETAVPTQIEHRGDGEKDAEDRVRDHEGRDKGWERLGDEELLAPDRVVSPGSSVRCSR